MRKLFQVLLITVLCVVCVCAIAENASLAPYGETEWIGISVLDATERIVQKGYTKGTAPDEAYKDYATYENANEMIERICFGYSNETLRIATVAMYCKADREAINLISNLTDAYGDSEGCVVSGVKGSAMYWQSEDNIYFIIYDGSYTDLTVGKLPYVFMQVAMNDTAESVESSNATEPTQTEVPTTTPIITSDITVTKAKLDRNSAGTTEAYITLHNNGRVTVDRIDFYVKCFDAYGNHIKGYDTYDVSSCFYDELLRAGASTSSDIYWTLYGFTGTKRIEVAIISYHTQSGITVEIPEDQLVWKSFK